MDTIRTLLATIACLGTLIVIHELGHYLVARWCGVTVLRFSVGMGKVVWSRRFGDSPTEWALSVIPLGGYVKMLDAREQDLRSVPEAELGGEFTRQNVWKRIAIVAAGPLANFLLAILLYALLFMGGVREASSRIGAPPAQTAAAAAGLRHGDLITRVNGEAVQGWAELRWQLVQAAVGKRDVRLEAERAGQGAVHATIPAAALAALDLEYDVPDALGLGLMAPPAVIGALQEGGPARRAGLMQGDVITAIDGAPIVDARALLTEVRRAPGRTLAVSVLRQGRPVELSLTPEAVQDRDANREGLVTVGKIRAELVGTVDTIEVRYGPLDAGVKAVRKVGEICSMTFSMLGRMIQGEVSVKNITGPITIAEYAGQTAKLGAEAFVAFVAFISVSLGLMNLLPIPVLDGGHLLYYSLEVLTGRPVSERFGEIAQRIGLGLLVSLMALAIFNDLARLL